MQLDALRRPRRALSMTSLIDVIFLLLLFFMLSSTFTRYASVDLGPSGSASGGSGSAPTLLISLRADGVLVNGHAPHDDLRTALVRYRDWGEERGTILVGIGATSQQLVTALETARSVGLKVTVAR